MIERRIRSACGSEAEVTCLQHRYTSSPNNIGVTNQYHHNSSVTPYHNDKLYQQVKPKQHNGKNNIFTTKLSEREFNTIASPITKS